ncbi:MAG: hypothetical protein ACTSQD_09560 [Promethearchaeota archaeon]
MGEILDKYKWMGPIIEKMDSDIKRIFMKNFRLREKNFFSKGDSKADVKNLVNCMLCPNMCRFDCGTLMRNLVRYGVHLSFLLYRCLKR